ncbi:MAG: antitoxin [Dehalococcoidia bacterium]|nr:antitoxin [Dehalococcoidia bacterium]
MKYELDEEEQEILEAFERGELKRVANADQEIERIRLAARNTLKKSKRVTLRVTEHDFNVAHIRAMEEGMPYQTLLSSVIHKYLSGRLVEKE